MARPSMTRPSYGFLSLLLSLSLSLSLSPPPSPPPPLLASVSVLEIVFLEIVRAET